MADNLTMKAEKVEKQPASSNLAKSEDWQKLATQLGVEPEVLRKYASSFNAKTKDDLIKTLAEQGFYKLKPFTILGTEALSFLRGDKADIIAALNEVDIEERKRISTALEGGMIIACALRENGVPNEETAKFVKNALDAKAFEVLVGGKMVTQQISLCDLVGTAYKGPNSMGKTTGTPTDGLLQDYINELRKDFGYQKTKKQIKETTIRNLETLNSLFLATSVASLRALDGQEYAKGTLARDSQLYKTQLDQARAFVLKISDAASPKFGKWMKDNIDDIKSGEFNRYFTLAFATDIFKWRGETSNVDTELKNEALRYVLDNAVQYKLTESKGLNKWQNHLANIRMAYGMENMRLEELSSDPKNATNFYNFSKSLLNLTLNYEPEKAGKWILAWQRGVQTEFMKHMKISSPYVGLLYNPNDIKELKSRNPQWEAQAEAAIIESSNRYLGISVVALRENDMRKVAEGVKKSPVYNALSAKGYSDEEVTKFAIDSIALVSKLYMSDWDRTGEILAAACAEMPKRSDLLRSFKLGLGKRWVPAQETQYVMEYGSEMFRQDAVNAFSEAFQNNGKTVGWELSYNPVGFKSLRKESLAGMEEMTGLPAKELAGNFISRGSFDASAPIMAALAKKGFDQANEEERQRMVNIASTVFYPAATAIDSGAKKEDVQAKMLDYIEKTKKDEITGAKMARMINSSYSTLLVKNARAYPTVLTETTTYVVANPEGKYIVTGPEYLAAGWMMGSGLEDAIIKNWDYQVESRKLTLTRRREDGTVVAVRQLSPERTGEFIDAPDFIARLHPGDGRTIAQKKIKEHYVALSKEYGTREKINALIEENDSVYTAVMRASERIVEKHYSKLTGAKTKEFMEDRIFLSTLALIQNEYAMDVSKLNAALKGYSLAFSALDVQAVMAKTITKESQRKGQTYEIIHRRENGTEEVVGTATYDANGRKPKVEMNPENKGKLDAEFGSYLYISRKATGGDELVGYMPALYYRQRRDIRGEKRFFRNSSANAEMTLINLRAASRPFDLVNTTSDIKEVNAEPWKFGIGGMVPGRRRALNPGEAPEQPLMMPAAKTNVEEHVQINTVVNQFTPITQINPDAVVAQGELRNIANSLGANLGADPGMDTITAAIQNIVTNNLLPANQNALANLPIGQTTTYYMWTADPSGANGTGNITTTLPPAGSTYSSVVITRTGATTLSVNVYDSAGQLAATGTIDMTTNTWTTRTVRAPVMAHVDLFNQKLPWGFQVSGGTQLSQEWWYRADENRWYKNLPSHRASSHIEVRPYMALSRPTEIGDGYILNPYIGGLYDPAAPLRARAYGGLGVSKSFSSGNFGLSTSVGYGMTESGGLPYGGIGASFFGVGLEAGVDLKTFRGPLYIGAGYDKDGNGSIDYGVRLMNIAGLAVPDVIIDGKGLIDWLVVKPVKWMFGTVPKKIAGTEAI